MALAAHRTITDDLLAVLVRIKSESGVGHAEIQGVVDQFACKDQWQERTGGIGFPLVEDIPQNRRAEFMAALSELSPSANALMKRASRAPNLSAAEIWPSRIE